jgi:hypothetical protein
MVGVGIKLLQIIMIKMKKSEIHGRICDIE